MSLHECLHFLLLEVPLDNKESSYTVVGGSSVPGSMLVTPNVGNGASGGCEPAEGKAVCVHREGWVRAA